MNAWDLEAELRRISGDYGYELRLARRKAHLSMGDVAEMLKTKVGTISDFETGKVMPTAELHGKLRVALDPYFTALRPASIETAKKILDALSVEERKLVLGDYCQLCGAQETCSCEDPQS